MIVARTNSIILIDYIPIALRIRGRQKMTRRGLAEGATRRYEKHELVDYAAPILCII